MEPVSFALVASLVLTVGVAIAIVRPVAIIDNPQVTLAILTAISIASLSALVQPDPLGFTIDVDPASEPLIGRNDPGIPIYHRATRDFGNDDVYVIAMETEDVFTQANLETLLRLTNELRRLPGIAEIESLARVLAIRYDPERDLVDLSRLFREVPSDSAGLEKLRERALSDPIYRKTWISADGRTTAINITFQPMTNRFMQ